MRLSVSQICSITTLLCAGSYALVPPRASATSRTGRILTGGTLPPDALDYAAHCVTHDLNSVISDRGHQPEVVHELLIADSMGMQDQYASPSDPVFYLHQYGMIDNMWAHWQLRDRETRHFALDGTMTTMNNPPSQNATAGWVADFGWLDTPKRLGEDMDSRSGLYCYRYECEEGAKKPC
ncbi:hypothetical protein PMIN04_001383 [Paraphaeosphaeria minitans]|uniref:Tyrosinase central domain protein n=1 Tax=Paraphaeosphaeria minitans TaxID=565426 RepID=A0A9P6KVE9_9PLEO|nr:tyrosinase central domain protein [Paraphaeosphaeria minitans]